SSAWTPPAGYALPPMVHTSIDPIPIGYGQYNGGHYYAQPFNQLQLSEHQFVQNPYYRTPYGQQLYSLPLQQMYSPSYGGYPQRCPPLYTYY
ncbi:hypothetical protein PMAYCL1PPCAC_06886, partial [Pristionchus mayeri]